MKKMAFIIVGVVLSLVFYLNPASAQRHGGGYSGVEGTQGDTLAVEDTQADTMAWWILEGYYGRGGYSGGYYGRGGYSGDIHTVMVAVLFCWYGGWGHGYYPLDMVGPRLCLSRLGVVLSVCRSIFLLLSLSQFLFLFLSYDISPRRAP